MIYKLTKMCLLNGNMCNPQICSGNLFIKEKGDKRLPILVETTARSSAQIELVANWIRRNIVY